MLKVFFLSCVISAQWVAVSLMVMGKIVELCVSVVTIVNYCAQCELLIFYLREIGLRMEEKTKDLNIIMKVMTMTNVCKAIKLPPLLPRPFSSKVCQ